MDKPKEILKAIVEIVKGNNKDVASERLAICVKCDNFVSRVAMCSICKCFTSVRVHNVGLHCPVNKW